MAVSSTTASDPAPIGHSPSQGRGPIRTCIGCRGRAPATELLRIVAERDATAVPDPRRRAAGRGAWLHPVPDCLDLAERRRAFGRALRVAGPLDPGPVREYVVRLDQVMTSGTPQE